MSSATEIKAGIAIAMLCGAGPVIFLLAADPLVDKGVKPMYVGLGTLLLIILLIILLT